MYMTYEDVKRDHPEKAEIFKLEELLQEAEIPFYFTFREDTRGVMGMDNNYDMIDWETYNFLIEIGSRYPQTVALISVCFSSEGEKELLEVLDMSKTPMNGKVSAEDGELFAGCTAERCMEIIIEYLTE